MKDHYSKYNTEYSWLITEDSWAESIQNVRETQFAIGNGLIGSRGTLEEIPIGSHAGTYMAGLYDSTGSQVSELINWPNPFNFKLSVEGEKIGVATMDTLEHKRILNLKHGHLSRRDVYRDTRNRKYDYQSMRFLSMKDKNIGVMQVIVSSLDDDVTLSIQTGIDTSAYNAGTVTEGRKKHYRIRELGQFENEGYLIVENFDKTHMVVFRSGFFYETNGKKVFAQDNIFDLKLKKKQVVTFTKIFFINHYPKSLQCKDMKDISERKFRTAFKKSFSSLLNSHIKEWKKLWVMAEVSIIGDPEVERNFRFNVYHMLICAVEDSGLASVGARTLSGEGYRGHIFWDTELFLLPFYLYILPNSAKEILLYRYKRLDAARRNAKAYGYKGAMFPWESAGSGKDETPSRAKDLDGKVIKIHTGQKEHHITADIAYAVYHYYNVTHDEKFLKDYGYEIMFETARFWASRVTYNKKNKKYNILDTIGPDEFHDNVDNNAFTNIMAKWNLIMAYKVLRDLKKTNPVICKKISNKINLSEKESLEWQKIASRLSINMNKKQIVEQFDGYFRKKYIKITEWDANHLPLVTDKITPRDYGKTQFVKQADVVMFLYLLSDVFNVKTKKANYDYYIERTLHNSSLSLPIYSIMASEVGDKNRAYSFFNTALHADVSNVNKNTHEGIHAACAGGVWQALINGFAGVRINKDVLSVTPRLPEAWRKIIFNVNWRNRLIKMDVTNNKIIFQIVSSNKKKIKIKVFGILRDIKGNRPFTFECRAHKKAKQSYYL